MSEMLEKARERWDLVLAAVRVGAIYLALAIAWILISDRAVESLLADPARIAAAQTIKGIVFTVLSAVVIGVLIFRELASRRGTENQLRSLIEQNLAGMYVVQDDRFVFANQRLAEIFGYEREELIGEISIGELVDPADEDRVRESVRRRLSGEAGTAHYRVSGLRKDGERIRLEAHGRAVEWEGRPAIMGLLLDVTEEERLRAEARRTERLETLGQLTGAVAHDFNNLLTAIITPLELCEDKIGADHSATAEIQEARENAERAAMLTRQLLSFGRGRMYDPRPVDLNDLVRSLEPMLRRLTTSSIAVVLDLTEDLPATRIDPSHFDQVLLNLTVNAANAIEARGEITVRTSVDRSVEAGPPDVILEVSDDGRGMDEQTQRRIFEPFFTTRADGTGLGLSTVHGIVTQEGGEISVDSEVGSGATFRIRLPGTSEPPEPLGSPDEPEEVVEGEALRGGRVLVVDDQEPVLKVIVRVLDRAGYEILSASNAEEAMAEARGRNGTIDLLVTDVGLPDVDGVALAGKIRELLPGVAVLYVSGYSDQRVTEKIAHDRTVHFLEKPFTVRELIDATRVALKEGPGASS